MTAAEELRVKVATIVGWKNVRGGTFAKFYGDSPNTEHGRTIVPNFPYDLNAMRDAENWLLSHGNNNLYWFPYCRLLHERTGGMGEHADAHQKATAFVDIIEPTKDKSQKPYLQAVRPPDDVYNPQYGDHRECECGHRYYRHFDTYEDMLPIGCKYCGCCTFVEAIEPERYQPTFAVGNTVALTREIGCWAEGQTFKVVSIDTKRATYEMELPDGLGTKEGFSSYVVGRYMTLVANG